MSDVRAALVLLAAALLASCKGRDAAPAADSTAAVTPSAPIAPAPAGSFAAVAAQELGALRPGITLEAWQRSHTADYVDRRVRIEAECAQTVSALRLGNGALVLRRAIFYVPVPDSSTSIAVDTADAADVCVLGAMRLTIQADSTQDSLVQRAANELIRVFGAGNNVQKATRWLPANPLSWYADSVFFGVARAAKDASDDPMDMRVETIDTVIVGAELPIVDRTGELTAERPDLVEFADDTAFLREVRRQIEDCEIWTDSLRQIGDSLVAGRTGRLAAITHYIIAEAAVAKDLLKAIEHYHQALAEPSFRGTPAFLRAHWIMRRLALGLDPASSIFYDNCGD